MFQHIWFSSHVAGNRSTLQSRANEQRVPVNLSKLSAERYVQPEYAAEFIGDTARSNRGSGHAERIGANDPNGIVICKTLD